jgi:hypothetical protein|tara:strand:+ start:193 stop:486 length:294 start_codon:yes stop_codon:yes gene_type:complete
MTWNKIDKEKVKRIYKQIAGTVTEKDGKLHPEIGIRGNKGHIWCWSPTLKQYIQVPRGSKGYIINEMKDNTEKVMIYCTFGEIVVIDYEEIIHTGYD